MTGPISPSKESPKWWFYRFSDVRIPIAITFVFTLAMSLFLASHFYIYVIVIAIVGLMVLFFDLFRALLLVPFFIAYTLLMITMSDYIWDFIATAIVAFLLYFFANTTRKKAYGTEIPNKFKWALVVIAIVCFGSTKILDIYGSRHLKDVLKKAQDKKYMLTSRELNSYNSSRQNSTPILVGASDFLHQYLEDKRIDYYQKENVKHLPWIAGDLKLEKKCNKKELQEIEEILSSCSNVLGIIDASLKLPLDSYPLEYPKGAKMWEMLLPHLSPLQNCAKFLAFRSFYYVNINKPDKAIEDVKNIFKIAKVLEKEPLLISFLVKIAIDRFAASALEYFLYHCQEPKYLQQIEELIKPLCSLQQPFVDGELAGCFAFADKGFLEKSWWYRMYKSEALGLGPVGWQPKGLIKWDIAIVLREQIESLKFFSKGEAAANQYLVSWKAPRNTLAFFTQALLPAWGGVLEREFMRLAEIRCIWIAVQLQKYKLKHGKMPKSLGFLKMDSLAMTLDPFSQKLLLYKKKGTHFLIYSVNNNRQDNGGVYERKKDMGIKTR